MFNMDKFRKCRPITVKMIYSIMIVILIYTPAVLYCDIFKFCWKNDYSNNQTNNTTETSGSKYCEDNDPVVIMYKLILYLIVGISFWGTVFIILGVLCVICITVITIVGMIFITIFRILYRSYMFMIYNHNNNINNET